MTFKIKLLLESEEKGLSYSFHFLVLDKHKINFSVIYHIVDRGRPCQQKKADTF